MNYDISEEDREGIKGDKDYGIILANTKKLMPYASAEILEIVALNTFLQTRKIIASKDQEIAALKQELVESDQRVVHAIALISTSISPLRKGEQILRDVKKLDTNFLLDYLPGGKVTKYEKLRTISRRPKSFSTEKELQKYLMGVLRESGSELMEVIDASESPVLFSTEKPDILFCPKSFKNACFPQSKFNSCSWPMVCFVCELKVKIFGDNGEYLSAGYEAIGQISNRAQNIRSNESLICAIMDNNRIQFWKFSFSLSGARVPDVCCWPNQGIGLFDRKEFGFSGIDCLISLFNADPKHLRPTADFGQLVGLIEGIRNFTVRTDSELTYSEIIPITGIPNGVRKHAVTFKASAVTGKASAHYVFKFWPTASNEMVDFPMTENFNREHAFLTAGNTNTTELSQGIVVQVGENTWTGLNLTFHGELTFHSLLKYLQNSSKNSTMYRNVFSWSTVKEAFNQVAKQLFEMHEKNYVHSDVKPTNVVFKLSNNEVHPKLIDFEHSVEIGHLIKGYTQGYCTNYLVNESTGDLKVDEMKASVWMDWESLYHSAHSMLLHEMTGNTRKAINNNENFWKVFDMKSRQVDSNQSSDILLTNRELYSIKHFSGKEADSAREFLKNFASIFAEARSVSSDPDRLSSYSEPDAMQIQELQKKVHQFFGIPPNLRSKPKRPRRRKLRN